MSKQVSEFQEKSMSLIYRGKGIFKPLNTGWIDERVSCIREFVVNFLCAMAERFPGGMITFDAVNALGLKGINAEVKPAGDKTKSFFSLEQSKKELESWSECIINVSGKDYAYGYLEGGYCKTPITQLFNWVMWTFHMSFMLHAEFAGPLQNTTLFAVFVVPFRAMYRYNRVIIKKRRCPT